MRGLNALTGEELLRLPVRLRGIQLGRPVDVILDLSRGRALGLDVLCGDLQHRFLPFGAARLEAEEIALNSALTLVDAADATFYRARAENLRELRGAPVEREGTAIGTLQDVVVEEDGRLTELVVEGRKGVERIEVAGRLALDGRPVLAA